MERRVTWATHMRARLPAFESVRGGELALLGLSQLRRVDETLPHLLQSLHKEGIAAVAVAAASLEALGNEAPALADQLRLPLILLPLSASLEEIEREVITFVVTFRGEMERGEFESRYQSEALMDVLQGNYAQPDEMLARARLLGYDLSTPQVVVIFEISSVASEYSAGNSQGLWGKRLRDELLRAWPACWVSIEPRRAIALLPLAPIDGHEDHERESEKAIFTRLQRVHARLQQSKAGNSHLPLYSGGIGRIARDMQEIPQSFREAQQALKIGQRLFGDGKLQSFALLGIYRLLFYLDGHDELSDFYRETLGPLLDQDARNNGALIATLEGFFQCNGNLSETARTMHLHRNSLLYRLGRIEELLGRSLEDPELRLSLQIALKIRHLLANRT